ncbi:tryptophan halogenase family protein [Sphingomonas sp. LT1P40]|uniref:tryptophan halogenase family protein n=1 Tax=Alteristakelama amylovorans TaxID=3096166 RepID=UPI002FC7AA67
MEQAIRRIVIVGGGTAGWLAACLIAARADRQALEITLIESPDIATIGVGEGTWPTMRRTLERIGIAEVDFLRACDGAFKQGSRFIGWRTGAPDDAYDHPFTPPADSLRETVAAWQDQGGAFASAVSPQPHVCDRDLAPRQRAMPDYAGALNYAYHLDAVKLAALLSGHATGKLGVRHIRDTVIGIDSAPNGDIAEVRTRASGAIEGDLFIDCTGHASMLLGAHFGVPFVDRSNMLPNDSALAVQVPVPPDSAIASRTHSTAHSAGWIWDIGLPARRGIGCVYSSKHLNDDAAAETLRAYLRETAPFADAEAFAFRKLSFRSGHLERFWERNCLAIGLSAGFLEPLEASAIVLIELSLDALLDNFPVTRGVMDIHARRFNELFRYRWDRIVEFLKLHYVLSERDEAYWRDHRATMPDRLADLLAIWRHQPPSLADLPAVDEIFPAASYQYVLYGMGFPAPQTGPLQSPVRPRAQVEQRARTLAASLPTNRSYLDALRVAAPPPAQERS